MGVERCAEIRFSKEGPRPRIEVAVPFGTTLAETFKLHDVLSKEFISGLSPRGCLACNSGVDIWIHEIFEEMVRIDLGTMKVVR
jgi:hypothetical protein